MNYNEIDTSLLKNSILKCIDSVKHSSSDEILSGISNSNIWNSNSKNSFKSSLEVLINKDYKKLEDELKKIFDSVDFIDNYNNLDKEIILKKEQIQSLSLDYEKNINEITILENEVKAKEVELLKIKNKLETLIN